VRARRACLPAAPARGQRPDPAPLTGRSDPPCRARSSEPWLTSSVLLTA
jgi:hypothetical protein